MSDMPAKGDRYEFGRGPNVLCIVTRVARDGSWVDLRMIDPSREWTKRQRLPLPVTFRRVTS